MMQAKGTIDMPVPDWLSKPCRELQDIAALTEQMRGLGDLILPVKGCEKAADYAVLIGAAIVKDLIMQKAKEYHPEWPVLTATDSRALSALFAGLSPLSA